MEDGSPNAEHFLGSAHVVNETSDAWLQRAVKAFRLCPMIMKSN